MIIIKKIINKELGQLLIEQGIINAVQLDQALAVQKTKGGLIGEVLVQLGYTKEEDIAKALTLQYGFPYIPLSSYDISSEVVNVIPSAVARKHMLIAIDKIGTNLTIAMANPLNMQVIEEIETVSGCKVQVFVCTVSDIKKAIEKYYK